MALQPTLMVHYECEVCSMSATCVLTGSAEAAWTDHMASHTEPHRFGRWCWEVVPLFDVEL